MSNSNDRHKTQDNTGEDTHHQYSHIECLLRALHQPVVNVSRPAESSTSSTSPSTTVQSHPHHHLGDIDEEELESLSRNSTEELPISSPSVAAASCDEKQKRPTFSLEINQSSSGDDETKSTPAAVDSSRGQKHEKNLERFNENLINLQKAQQQVQVPLSVSHSTGKPFAFYQRIHRHNSAHSLNIPNIVITDDVASSSSSGQPTTHPHHKRFSFGLRRHSHAVVELIICVSLWFAMCVA